MLEDILFHLDTPHQGPKKGLLGLYNHIHSLKSTYGIKEILVVVNLDSFADENKLKIQNSVMILLVARYTIRKTDRN